LKAAQVFESALKLLPSTDPRCGELHRERAGCFLRLRQYADVVVETTRALSTDGKDAQALYHRACAYRELGDVKKGIADATVCAGLAVADDDRHGKVAVEACKQIVALNKTKSTPQGLGGLNLAPAREKKTEPKESAEQRLEIARQRQLLQERAAVQLKLRQKQQAWGPPVSVKASYGDDSRVVICPSMIAHCDLVTSITNKFPDRAGDGAFQISFLDEAGEKKPVNTRADFMDAVAVAVKERETAASDDANVNVSPLSQLPSVKLIVEDVPPALPETEGEGATENEVVEIDEWILDFAALFREHLGIDAEAHLDLHSEVRFFVLFLDWV
jgi:hypothetical protein|tara:strand:- start:2475 stop:3464 length:990 start_codon:yes stop_codon:yes gene_type:complete